MITSRHSDPSTQVPRGSRFQRPGLDRGVDAPTAPALLLARDGGETRGIPIPVGWSRVGRSPAADIHLDDPSVSRRHAVIVRATDGGLQVIDDRSLSGIRVNGRRVSWAELDDGDELLLGDVRLIVAATAAHHSTA
ncbi:MAG TPA: FHA domain-containing protein [Solirubrobacterales bacterium]|nr:FHA domain-containing protein [Solirubrobacterales bacterium]